MSNSPPQYGADGWWEASDGKWYPPNRHPNYQPPTNGPNSAPASGPLPEHYTYAGKRYFQLDPTRRHTYREIKNGNWLAWVSDRPDAEPTFDSDGAAIAANLPDPRVPGALPKPESIDAEADPIGVLLQFVGWAAVALSIVAGLIIYGEAQDLYSDTSGAFGVIVGVAGTVQGLLLVGFGRVVGYLRTTADQTRRSADLIERSLRDRV